MSTISTLTCSSTAIEKLEHSLSLDHHLLANVDFAILRSDDRTSIICTERHVDLILNAAKSLDVVVDQLVVVDSLHLTPAHQGR